MDLQTKNTLKLVSFNCRSIKRSVEDVRNLCKSADIIALQETWLLPHNLNFVNSIDKEFSCSAKSSVDTSKGILQGRPYGGIALLWRSSLFTSAEILQCDSDRIIVVRLGQGDRCMLVCCVYMPTNDDDNLPEFTQCLAQLNAIVESADIEYVFALGDFNAHPGTLFGKELVDYCIEQSLRCIDIERLNTGAYTYISDAHGTCRWLDHCIVTEAAAALVTDVAVIYGSYWSDHLPLVISCNFYSIVPKKVIRPNYNLHLKYKWGERSNRQVILYRNECTNKFYNILNNFTSYCDCLRVNCTNFYHYKQIDKLYCDIVSILQSSSDKSVVTRLDKRKRIIGWNVHVRKAHIKARHYMLQWMTCGRPRSGDCYENMRASRREFKAALKYAQNNEEKIKLDILARNHSQGSFVQFWKETKKLNKKTCVPVNVEGEDDQKNIANIFMNAFNSDSLRSDSASVDNGQSKSESRCRSSETYTDNITAKQIAAILKNMKRGKSPGHDGLSLEHILNAGQYIHEILARFFNLCLRHGYLPMDMIKTLVVPIPKNKTGDISSVANYRPISLATIVAKVLERVIHSEIAVTLKVDDGQFGFRSNVSTDMAIFSLKQVTNYYVDNNTSVYACFLDLSRAFDTINHDLLWHKLAGTSASPEMVDLLKFWYKHQTNNVRWGQEQSDSYRLSCGVRQGGLTSPDLFNLYVNDLIVELSRTPVGLRLDDRYVNNLSYADDMVLLSPTIKGLRQLLQICERYANEHDLKYNAKKTEMVIFRAGKGPDNVPNVWVNGTPVKVVEQFKYLGHIVKANRNDDEDIERQRRALNVVGNMIIRRFRKADYDVKLTLFRSFCQTFYTCQLWTKYTKKAHDGIRVAYNNIFRQLMGLKRYCSATGMFLEARVNTFNAIQRHRIASFMRRVDRCGNSIVKSLADRLHMTETYKHWSNVILYVKRT